MITVAALEGYLRDSLGDQHFLALYTTLPPGIERVYLPTGECEGQGYMPGGKQLQGARVIVDGNTAILTFDQVVWPNSTIKANGAIVYNRSKQNRTLAVIKFGKTINSINGMFRAAMPQATASEGLIRLSAE